MKINEEGKVLVDRNMVINCMIEHRGGDGEIAIMTDRRDEIRVAYFPLGGLKTFCEQNACEVLEKFEFCPGDNGYDDDSEDEANHYIWEDADYELGEMTFENIEFV